VAKRGGKHGPSIKCPDIYEALRRKGYSKKKAAKISNSRCGIKRKAKRRKGRR
jgi:hypothetical protein